MTRADLKPAGAAADFGRALLDASAETPEGVIGPDGNSAPKRFNVYRNNVIVSLCEALGQTFPAVRSLLGDEYFTALAKAFVTAHPPVSPVLIWYGGDFPGFLEAFPPLEAYPYLADVARAEWAWLQAYHAEDAAPLDPALLAAVDPHNLADIRLRRHPAAEVIASRWPLFDLLRANRFDPGATETVDLAEAQPVLIARPELDVGVMPLRPGAAEFVLALFEGATLGKAAESGQAAAPDFDLSASLSDCLSAGSFTGLETI